MKRSFSYFIVLLTISLLLTLLITFGCNAPAIETEAETAAQTQPSAAATETLSASEDLHAETPEETSARALEEEPIAPLSDISCIMGYWEVEMDSLLAAANSLVSSNSMIVFTRAEPSIIYSFYEGDPGIDTTLYRMDIWYDNVLVRGNIDSIDEESSKNVDMHINGVLTAEIISEREGQIVYRPVEGENSLEITDMWLDGELMSDSPLDISDIADTNVAREFLFECLGNGRIRITYQEAIIYLSATTRTHA